MHAHEQALTRPAAVASRLSLLLHGMTNLKVLRLNGFCALAGQPPVRPEPPYPFPASTPPPPPSLRSAAGC